MMARSAHRVRIAPRLELLEGRALLSGAAPLARDADPASSVLIGFRDGASATVEAAVVRSIHGQVVATYPNGSVLVATPSPSQRDLALRKLNRHAAVRYAEPNSIVRVDATVAATNDPLLFTQWALDSSNGAGINAAVARSITEGSTSTIVAVIDSGLDLTHPEFAGRIWTNPGEVDGISGVDNDGDGLANDLHGWNFLTNTSNVNDDNGHGTHVAGILAATGNNGIGVAGVDWKARIMPLKFIGADGNGSVDDALRAIYYAVDHGARVINASWGGGAQVQALTDAISYANARNVVFVTAAGNDGTNNGTHRSYPANDRLPNVISVAATDINGSLASFSNYGATTVDLAAPGVNIRSTVPGGYATYSGTSTSTPYVSGVVSLLVGLHPELTAAQLVQRVLNAARPLPGLQGKVITGGVVDAGNTVNDGYAAAYPGVTAATHGSKRRQAKHIVRKFARRRAVKLRASGFEAQES